MTRPFMMVGAILGLVAMVFFVSWPAWKWIKFRPVSASLYERAKAAVDQTGPNRSERRERTGILFSECCSER